MVECILSLDSIFGSLTDPTRRDILKRVSGNELSVSEIAEPYDMSLAAVSKHIQVLEEAQLVTKQKLGKKRIVRPSPLALQEACNFLRYYQNTMDKRLDSLEEYLTKEEV